MEKSNPFIRTLPGDSVSVVKSSATAVCIPNQFTPVTSNRIFLLAIALHSFILSKVFIIGLLLLVTGVESVNGANRNSVPSGKWSATSPLSTTLGGIYEVSVPVAADNAYIEESYTVTLNQNTASLYLISIDSCNQYTSSRTYTVSVMNITSKYAGLNLTD